ncbi:MAG: 1-deoxy-D-xylulose-5-phosphate reductoisomerase [Thermodesulfobacteriota bacterium]|nr:1-deoxy-D-xylulose-5-phosphate reductoisomerase [Thermodesulfobacteriota bacterium]
MKNISILGSTGSIGVNALYVIGSTPSLFKVVAMSAGKNVSLLKEQIDKFRPKVVSVLNEDGAYRLKEMLNSSSQVKILWGVDGYREVASVKEVDMVVSAIVGAAGLLPTMEAIDAGKNIALANKETMVMAGSLVIEKAASKGVAILPVDSEHNAIFQCLAGSRQEDIKRIILTASGGPFLYLPLEELAEVKLADALKHPNWDMGKKITIDSASMMNKGLEIIEAKWLFDVDIDKIDVHIHPQSIVHSMVEYIDGSVVAQLGVANMRGPISYALSYPERLSREDHALNLFEVGPLEFIPPDFDKFPNLKLAYLAGRKGGTMPSVLNASNEVAVEAFIAEEIRFIDIPVVVRETLFSHSQKEISSIKDVLEADRWARDKATEIIGKRLKVKGAR